MVVNVVHPDQEVCMQKLVEIEVLFGPDGHNMPRIELMVGDIVCVAQKLPGHGSPKADLVDCTTGELPLEASLQFPPVAGRRLLACYKATQYGRVFIRVTWHDSIRKVPVRVSQPYLATPTAKK